MDFTPPPLWLPPKPAIIRPSEPVAPLVAGMLPGMVPVVAGGGLSSSFASIAEPANGDTPSTISGMNLGPAFAGRKILAAICFNSSRTITSISVGGVGLSLLYAAGDSGIQPLWYWGTVPSGTSANFEMAFSGGTSTYTVALWSIRGWGGTLHAGAKNGTGAESNPSLNISVVAGGSVFAAARNIGAESFVGDWSGVDEDAFLLSSINNLAVGVGSRKFYAANASAPVSVVASNVSRMTAVSLSP